VSNKKKPEMKKTAKSDGRLEEFLLISKIHAMEASAAKDRQLAMETIQKLYGSNGD
jgi:hypothetical protein